MYLTTQPIDVAKMLHEARPCDGALCLFLGVVRNENAGRETISIDYEAYGSMAEKEMERIAGQIAAEWPSARLVMAHRVGRLAVGEVSVAVAAVAPHRAEAFAACRASIDRIKTTVPIWKKEHHPDGSSGWVDPTRESGDLTIG
ncbi:MAG TPA: molybdenum cofactor biosynthesis protein MoaE [Thermoanaerobaculia bacterium]|nr:molybdenum cofactor biosynthesis protein MoaE [Thermoanaerobaculia bacterium]